jgi:hypothetical protein
VAGYAAKAVSGFDTAGSRTNYILGDPEHLLSEIWALAVDVHGQAWAHP